VTTGKREFYTHAESGSAFTSNAPIDEVLPGDGCVELVSREQYLTACLEFGIEPEAMVTDEDILGDLL